MIDWKWEYNEAMWCDLTVFVREFLESFDAASIKYSDTGDRDAIDQKSMTTIVAAKPTALKFALQTEAFACFGKAIRKQHGWLDGCPCHDWIWAQDKTEARKQKTV